MLSFHEIHSGEDARETFSIDTYKNIKPEENLSKEEAIDFWKSEFRQKREIQEENIFDDLLSETFNRSEDEMDFEFEFNDKILTSLNEFKTFEWSNISEKDKIQVMKNLVDSVGNGLGLKNIPKIKICEDVENSQGGYNPLTNIISINRLYCDNPIELVDTLTHELRHAYQNERAEILETWQDAIYKFNFDNYITPIPLPKGGYLCFMDYYNQYVEVEARAFANLFTEAMR